MSDCRIAGRLSACLVTRFWASAQPWHRCISFFCLLTMSVRCTVAGFEHNWHFTPRPFLLPQSEWSTLLQPADLVAQAGRLLVGLLADRLLELLAELDQLGLGLLALRQAARSLAGVASLAVD